MNDRSEVPPVDAAPAVVSIVGGDRLCRQCGYNLIGQSVTREPHYGLFVARCPECGQVADVLEYPVLGRWAARWTSLLVTLWFLVLIGMLFPSGAAAIAFPLVIGEDSSRLLERQLEAEHEQFVQLATAGEITATNTSFQAWWNTERPAARGWQNLVDWRAFLLLIPASIVLFAIGWFWSVALLGLRRPWLLVFAALLLTGAGVIVGAECVDWLNDPPSRPWRAARTTVAPPLAAMTLAYLAIPFVTGLMLGRALTRILVRGLLPARLAGALAFLWLADGRQPPRGRLGPGATRATRG